jgi:ABC-type nitrate/sulfonate/bicarbonate transport system permease component
MALQPITVAPPRKRWKPSAALRDRMINVLSPVGLLLLWEAAAAAGMVDVRFFPPPSGIARTFFTLLQSGELGMHTWASLKRLFWGSLLGGVPALILGILMGIVRPIRAFVDPLIAATYPIPKSSILPLVLLIFGLGEMSKVVMVAIGVFFPVAINATAGVLEINKIYLDVGKNFRAGRWNTFRTIALPGALPFIMTGVRLGIGMGLVLIAIAEMVGAKSGLGAMIWSAWETFAVEKMYVGLSVIAIIGFALTLGLNEIERLVIPWKADRA